MEEKEYNPIQEIQPQAMKDKIKEWYLLKEKVGKGKTFGDLVQRQENLEALEKQDIEKLESLQKTIDGFASELGVQFDKETGAIHFEIPIESGNSPIKNEQIAETIGSSDYPYDLHPSQINTKFMDEITMDSLRINFKKQYHDEISIKGILYCFAIILANVPTPNSVCE